MKRKKRKKLKVVGAGGEEIIEESEEGRGGLERGTRRGRKSIRGRRSAKVTESHVSGAERASLNKGNDGEVPGNAEAASRDGSGPGTFSMGREGGAAREDQTQIPRCSSLDI